MTRRSTITGRATGRRATRRRATASLAALAALATPAQARPDLDSLRGGALLHLDVSYVHREDALPTEPDVPPPPLGADRGLALAGVRLRGFLSKGFPIGYLIGLDLQGGSTVRGGFAYRADLYLLGAGARLGRIGVVGIGTGVGASGAVGTLDDGVELPVDAFFELGLGSRLRVVAHARAAWLGGAPRRERGSRTVPWTDEVDGMVGLRVGRRYRDFDFPSGNGYFLGVAYREAEGARYVGATLGYSVDLGTP